VNSLSLPVAVAAAPAAASVTPITVKSRRMRRIVFATVLSP
jgi:hypothetical protein